MICYIFATELSLIWEEQVGEVPLTRIRVTEYFQDADQSTSLTFCDYNRIGI